jgi:trk system potassium uptake protein TrkA
MKNILLIGMGRFGYHIVKELSKLNVEILAIDKNEEYLKNVSNYTSKTLIGDSTDIEFLKTIGVNTFDECIVSIGDEFQNSLETVLNLKELGAKRITARASKESQEKLLLKIGADFVVYPEKQLAKWTALHCGTDSVFDFMDLDNGYGIYEINIPDSWNGKTLAELDLRKRHNINIIGIKDKNKMRMVLGPNVVLNSKESVLVLAKEEDVHKFIKK